MRRFPPFALSLAAALTLTACGNEVVYGPDGEPGDTAEPSEETPVYDPANPVTETPVPEDGADCEGAGLCLDDLDSTRLEATREALSTCTVSEGFEVPEDGVKLSRVDLVELEDGTWAIEFGAANLFGDCACDYPGYGLEILGGEGALGDVFSPEVQTQSTQMQLYGIGGCEEMADTIPLFLEEGQQLKLRATAWRGFGDEVTDSIEFTVRR